MQVDSNGNGSLDSREIEVLLNSLAGDTLGEGRRVSKAEIRNVMEKVDSNKDRRIAFDEFIRVSARCPHALLQACIIPRVQSRLPVCFMCSPGQVRDANLSWRSPAFKQALMTG